MKLGILKATRKASVPPVAPKTVARAISRNSPKTRESRVMPPTVKVDRSSLALRTVSAVLNRRLYGYRAVILPVAGTFLNRFTQAFASYAPFPRGDGCSGVNFIDKARENRHYSPSFFKTVYNSGKFSTSKKTRQTGGNSSFAQCGCTFHDAYLYQTCLLCD